MTARTATLLYKTPSSGGRKAALYIIPTVTTSDTVDLSADFSELKEVIQIPDTDTVASSTVLGNTPVTAIVLSQASVAAQAVWLFALGSSA